MVNRLVGHARGSSIIGKGPPRLGTRLLWKHLLGALGPVEMIVRQAVLSVRVERHRDTG